MAMSALPSSKLGLVACAVLVFGTLPLCAIRDATGIDIAEEVVEIFLEEIVWVIVGGVVAVLEFLYLWHSSVDEV